jgi:hypothetical protein
MYANFPKKDVFKMSFPNLTTTFFFSAATGLISAYLSFKRGRNPFIWFFVGFFFGMLGTIALFFTPKIGKKEETMQASPIKLDPQPYLYGPVGKFWYYVNEAREQIGPLSYEAISEEWKSGKLANKTLVWHEDMTEWEPLEQLIKSR